MEKKKQNRILNAAMTVFSQSPYGKASTDDIAAMADISKGSLFYHFKNKADLYCYLYEYSCKKLYEKINENKALIETDFFERNKKIIAARVAALMEYPCIYDFALRAYYETDSAVAGKIKAINRTILKDAFVKLNENIDISRFKNKEDIGRAIKMLIFIGDGIMKERKANGRLDLKEIQSEIYEYMSILRRGFYTDSK